MPEHVQPGRALGPGAQQAGRREQAGEREHVRDGHDGGEEVTAGQYEQRPRSQETELTEQQDRRDQIVDRKRRLIDRDEGPDRRERHLGERHRGEKDRGGHQHDREGEPTLAPLGRQGRQEYPASVT